MMTHSEFFPPHGGVRLDELAAALNLRLANEELGALTVTGVAPVHRAKQGDLCYILSRKNKAELETCQATAIICDEALASIIPAHIAVLTTAHAHTAFAKAGNMLHPAASRPLPVTAGEGVHPASFVDPTAVLEDDVIVEPMAVVGAGAHIGSGTRIGAGAVIGPQVKIGRDCTIASNATVLCAFLGNRVIIHNGARIGQDGFGYAPGPTGMIKIVQIGRVIIQDDVEIGANTCIDRGAMDDTVIGEGTKIDNLVMIGHNVRIGRHTAIVSQVGVAGSARIGDGVQIGGQTGVNGHIEIGSGAKIAAMSGVAADVPPGQIYGGVPARPYKDFMRDMGEILLRSRSGKKGDSGK